MGTPLIICIFKSGCRFFLYALENPKHPGLTASVSLSLQSADLERRVFPLLILLALQACVSSRALGDLNRDKRNRSLSPSLPPIRVLGSGICGCLILWVWGRHFLDGLCGDGRHRLRPPWAAGSPPGTRRQRPCLGRTQQACSFRLRCVLCPFPFSGEASSGFSLTPPLLLLSFLFSFCISSVATCLVCVASVTKSPRRGAPHALFELGSEPPGGPGSPTVTFPPLAGLAPHQPRGSVGLGPREGQGSQLSPVECHSSPRPCPKGLCTSGLSSSMAVLGVQVQFLCAVEQFHSFSVKAVRWWVTGILKIIPSLSNFSCPLMTFYH